MSTLVFLFLCIIKQNPMIAEMNIPIQKIKQSKLKDVELNGVPFGKYFSDHMLEADYEDGEWKNVIIKPYQPLLLEPSVAALHYGQAIFEGIKAYKNDKGEAFIFRPLENFQRFNISAERMQMPPVPQDIFIEGMRKLIELEKQWIPTTSEHSLYIRPFMFSTDSVIGVRPSETYKFLIILSPSGPYYSVPIRIYVEEKYTRAAPGGAGFSKNAGNYGASMYPTALAKKAGYDQVLWTDAFEHKYVQEVGTMNIFFIIDKKAITPALDAGTILDGVTRSSAITLLKEMGYTIEERVISIDEIIDAYKNKTLKEVFGTGTAATITMIKELRYKDFVMQFDINSWEVCVEVKQKLMDIREGKVVDRYGWLMSV